MRIWVWWRPIEGFVPEECNYPAAVRRLLINVIAAYCGRSCMYMYQAKTYSGDSTIRDSIERDWKLIT